MCLKTSVATLKTTRLMEKNGSRRVKSDTLGHIVSVTITLTIALTKTMTRNSRGNLDMPYSRRLTPAAMLPEGLIKSIKNREVETRMYGR